jgi:hypothetical protein
LFINGEQGFLFVNDISTMYQDSAGTIPAALEQPVGLWVDSRFGAVRGGEVFSDAGVTFAGASARVSPGVYRIYSSDGSLSLAQQAGALVIGKSYEVNLTVDSITTLGTGVVGDTTGGPVLNTTGPKRWIGVATGTAFSVKRNGGVTDIQISGLSIREVPGNHATQPTSANRFTVSARYNKCTNNNANPTDLTGMTKGGDAAAVLSVVDDAAAIAAAGLSAKCTSGKVYKLDNSAGAAFAQAQFSDAAANVGTLNAHQCSVYWRGAGNGNLGLSNTISADQAMPAGYQSFAIARTPAATTNFMVVRAQPGAVVYFILNDLRESIHAIPGIPTPQVVTGAGAAYNSAGFPVRLKCNGTNQWMQTGSIDFSGTDKMTVFAGVTKLSDAALGTLLEHGVGGVDARCFTVDAPRTAASTDYGADLRDGVATPTTIRLGGYAAPSSAVLTVAADYAGATAAQQLTVRVNGALPVQTVTGGMSSGKFSNYPAYIGARGSATPLLFLSGDIYCLSARGALTTDSLIAQMEQWANGRMGRVY